MKLICTQENLKKALSIVGNITNKNTALPILNNVLVKAEGSVLKLSATNLELGVSYWIGGKIEKEGEITIPTKLFYNLVASLPGGKVEIKLQGEDVLNIKCGGYKTSIKGISSSEYPLAPKIEAEPVLEMKSLEFKDALSQVLPAVSSSESRMELTGILFNLSKLKENKLILAATDTYRLAEKTINLEKDGIDLKSLEALGDSNLIIVPKNAAQELARDLDSEEEKLKITVAENQILFSFGNGSLISRLIEGKYPDYKQIIPESFNSKVIVDTSEMLNAIRVASLFTDALSGNIKLKLSPDLKSLEIDSSASAVGSNSAKIPAEISEKEQEKPADKDGQLAERTPIIYNYKYLIDGLGSIGSDKAVFEINGESHPTVLAPFGGKGFLYLIMPIRV